MGTIPVVDHRVALIGVMWPLLCAIAIFLLGPRNGVATYLVIAAISFSLALALALWKKQATAQAKKRLAD